ncbi:flavodoxin domain-containing protein [Alloiococcus sp. CFN-8]|uniref:flavodoxin domain-containing protein n=1 Tax=Alloiococcus sp. CFN-8 TaxID=3416081 RepID=UPI003CEBB79F
MKIIVIYRSKTGFTQSYADMIAEELKCKAVNINKLASTELKEYDAVIFGGRLSAGKIDGLTKAKELCKNNNVKNFIIFTTGATPNTAVEVIDKAWQANLTKEELASVPHFYMQSGLCYEKMSGFDRFIMKIFAYIVSKKKVKDTTEAALEQAIQSSHDISSREYIEPLVKHVKDTRV